MDVLDGFIVGIFNYCDRWCERCAFTSRCRVFAGVAEIEASRDRHLRPVIEALPLPEDAPPVLPRLRDHTRALVMEAPADPMPGEHVETSEPRHAPDAHERLRVHAERYRTRVRDWLRAEGADSTFDPSGPVAAIGWFHTLVGAKVHRALGGLEFEPYEEDDGPRDSDGSAKVALLGVERSHTAWLQMVESGRVSMAEATPFVTELVWLGEAIESVFPNARAFVRPGFDEPDAVARLEMEDRLGSR